MEPGRQEYRGHRIELRKRTSNDPQAAPGDLDLLIDGEPVPYGQLPGGLYALHENAYEWSRDLLDLAKRLTDFRRRNHQMAGKREPGRGGG